MPKPGERKKPKPVPGPIARNLRAKIEGCGLNYTKLADFAGVTQPQITKFMQGFDINLATAEKLLETLDEVYAGTLSAQAEIAEIAREQHKQMRAVITHYMQIDDWEGKNSVKKKDVSEGRKPGSTKCRSITQQVTGSKYVKVS